MNIVDYINAFERLNNQTKYFDMQLPTNVLSYKLLKMQIYQMKKSSQYELL